MQSRTGSRELLTTACNNIDVLIDTRCFQLFDVWCCSFIKVTFLREDLFNNNGQRNFKCFLSIIVLETCFELVALVTICR